MARYEVKDYYDRTEWIEVERSPIRQVVLTLLGYAGYATHRESIRYSMAQTTGEMYPSLQDMKDKQLDLEHIPEQGDRL